MSVFLGGVLLLLLNLLGNLLGRRLLGLLLHLGLSGRLCLLLLILLDIRRSRCGLVVVIVAAADERECCRADTCRRSGTQKHAPRHANVGERGQGVGQSRGLCDEDKVFCNY